MTRLSISAQFSIKDLPAGYRGYCGGNINYGKDREIPLARMLVSMCRDITEHYALFMDADAMNEELDKFREFFASVNLVTISGLDGKSNSK